VTSSASWVQGDDAVGDDRCDRLVAGQRFVVFAGQVPVDDDLLIGLVNAANDPPNGP